MNFRSFYAIISAEKHVAILVTRWQGLHKRGCISKRISKKFLEIFLEIDIPYGVRDFSRFEQKRAENPCKHWGFSFFYRLLSSRKIRHFPMGDCALKTVWASAHVGSNPTPSANKKGTFVYQKFLFCLSKPQAWYIIDARSAAYIIKGALRPCISSRASVHFACGLMIYNTSCW